MTTSPVALVPALALAVLTAACELLPCELNPNAPACDTGASASATATASDTDGADTEADTEAAGGCPAPDSLWGPCGDGTFSPNGLTCGGHPCVVLDAEHAVCTLPCPTLPPGSICHVQTPYCGDPMSDGQVLEGICVDDVCVEPCGTAADCTHPGQECVDWAGQPSCAWPTGEDQCEPEAGTAWGDCHPDGNCDSPSECVTVLLDTVVCAPPCDVEGAPCDVEVTDDCGGAEPWAGTCWSGHCVRDCVDPGDCPDGVQCMPSLLPPSRTCAHPL